jgi:hypothetical protein
MTTFITATFVTIAAVLGVGIIIYIALLVWMIGSNNTEQ